MRPVADSSLRVAHLVLALNIGGLERFVLDLIRFKSHPYSTTVICLEEPGALAPEFDHHGIEVCALGWKQKSKGSKYTSLLNKVRELKPNVLHTHNPIPHFYGSIAARLTGVTGVVHTKHGRNDPQSRKVSLMSGVAGRLSDAVVAVSHDAANYAIRVDHIPERRVQVLWNGIDLQKFSAQQRSPRELKRRRAVCVARLDPLKDHVTLLRAARIVRERIPDFELAIVGDGPERTRLEALTGELGLGDCVVFHGFSGDVMGRLRAAELFVLTTLSEGVSLTLLEAMAAGLPVVTTSVGGNPEVVEDGKTGILIPTRSAEAAAESIEKLLTEPGLAEAMGAQGRKRVEEHFDMRTVARRYESIYEAAIGLSSAERHGTFA